MDPLTLALLLAAAPSQSAPRPPAGSPSGGPGTGGPAPAAVRVERILVPLGTADPQLENALRGMLFPPAGGSARGTGADSGSAQPLRPEEACREAGPIRYVHIRWDLNGDGVPETLAAVLGAATCGTGGCTLVILRRAGGRVEPITTMSLFRSPLLVSRTRHRGWNDLIVPVRRDGGRTDLAVLSFDGLTYPTNPSLPPARPLVQPEVATVVLELPPLPFASQGHLLPCRGGEGQ